MSPGPKRGKPYLPARVPRNPRYDNAIARRSSSPHSTVGIVGVPFWSALLGKLDDNTVISMSVPSYEELTRRHELGTHKALSIEGVQSILGILLYKRLT